jgi:hypothetical protein
MHSNLKWNTNNSLLGSMHRKILFVTKEYATCGLREDYLLAGMVI